MSPRRELASAMGAAADELVALLGDDQRQKATWPMSASTADERTSWFYTPTDHHGLALADMTPRQQRATHKLVATGLSTAGYVTVAAIIGLENVLDHVEGWQATFDRERGRDPQLYWIALFGTEDGAVGADRWGWRFGGHHISLNFTIDGGEVVATTPLFLGADPAAAPLLGPHLHRPLGAAEDLGRELVRSLGPDQLGRALLTPVAPSDLITGNRPRVVDGDRMLPLPSVFRQPLVDDVRVAMEGAQRQADERSGITDGDHDALAFTSRPKGLAVAELDPGQRDALGALLDVYLHRLPDGVADEEQARVAADVDQLHFAWAGSIEPGQPHYYRLQGPDLLIEYDNTQRDVNHVHTVWRRLDGDFGGRGLGADALAEHYATDPHHRS